VVLEPYLWLDPPPDHPGGAQGESATVAVEAGGNALVALATPESEPQAQLLATPGSLILPAGATSIIASIIPVEPVSLPPDGYIDGNTYRIELTDQAGNEVTADPSALVSIVLRSADETLANGKIERFDGSRWEALETSPAGLTGFLAVVTRFGDFAVVAAGESPYPTPTPAASVAASPASTEAPPSVPATPTPTSPPRQGTELPLPAVGAIAAVIIVAIGLGALVLRRRRRPPDDARGGWGQ
jgi:hypothetical protein